MKLLEIVNLMIIANKYRTQNYPLVFFILYCENANVKKQGIFNEKAKFC